jgi:hypothetical protein
MRARKRGTIVNVSSMDGIASLPVNGYYSSSKFALEGLTVAPEMFPGDPVRAAAAVYDVVASDQPSSYGAPSTRPAGKWRSAPTTRTQGNPFCEEPSLLRVDVSGQARHAWPIASLALGEALHGLPRASFAICQAYDAWRIASPPSVKGATSGRSFRSLSAKWATLGRALRTQSAERATVGRSFGSPSAERATIGRSRRTLSAKRRLRAAPAAVLGGSRGTIGSLRARLDA